jgi:SEC-C motif-containing protein
MKSCYCGSNKPFQQCCNIFISAIKIPETAEELMRSRYSAYVCRDRNYLNQTALPELKSVVLNEMPNVTWDRLEVCKVRHGLANHDTGVVEFKAFFYDELGQLQWLWEESQFIKKAGQWYYASGIILN